mgnify:CR=1 FL=1
MKASISCGILSPSCDAQFAIFQRVSTPPLIKLHIIKKNVLKSLITISERIAVNRVTKTPYKSKPKVKPSRLALRALYSFSRLFL